MNAWALVYGFLALLLVLSPESFNRFFRAVSLRPSAAQDVEPVVLRIFGALLLVALFWACGRTA
jgi:hypothetical protein